MPDEIARQRRRLARALKETFDNGDDAILAEAILLEALRDDFGHLIKDEDRPRYLAALERLPKGSTARPQLLLVSSRAEGVEGAGSQWRVTFTDGRADYESARRFATETEANDWARDFLVRFRGEINKR